MQPATRRLLRIGGVGLGALVLLSSDSLAVDDAAAPVQGPPFPMPEFVQVATHVVNQVGVPIALVAVAVWAMFGTGRFFGPKLSRLIDTHIEQSVAIRDSMPKVETALVDMAANVRALLDRSEEHREQIDEVLRRLPREGQA